MANLTISANLAVSVQSLHELYRRGLTLRMLAAAPAVNSDVANRNYVSSVRSTFSMTQTQINEAIASGFSTYATKSYVDSQDTLNATKAQVDAADADRLKLSTVNANNGVAGLDAQGRVSVARISGSTTQRWPKGFYTPASYAAATSSSGSEVTIFTQSITSPGFTYKLLISGQLDCRTLTNGDAPVVRVRLGGPTGPVVATGTAQSSQYRYGVDNFNRVSTSLGAGWEQFYDGPGTAHVETSTKAYWSPDGMDPDRLGIFRKITDFSTTVDDYQEVYYQVADSTETGGVLGKDPHNRIYGRMNSTRSSYVAFDMTDTKASLVYSTGGTEYTLVGPNSGFSHVAGDQILAQFGYFAATNKRRFRLIRNGTAFIDYTDNASATSMGADNRGWGFGMRAGVILFRQALPGSLDWIALSDPLATWNADPENYSPAVITNVDFASQTALVGAQTLYVTLRATSTSTVYSTAVQPKLHVMAIPS